ncbi:hypothetical protein ACHAPU_010607 [Fusarium lateritium]
MRRFYVTKIRPVITYACGAWFVARRRNDRSTLSWSITMAQLEKLDALQAFCLRRISGAFGNTPIELLEKELHIEDIWTVLYTQATVQRAKSLLSPDQRLAVARRHLVFKTGHTYYQDLLTNDAKTAVNWALKYFDIEQFDNARAKVHEFPVIDGIISLRPIDQDFDADEHEDPHSRFPHDPNQDISHMPKRRAWASPLARAAQSSSAVSS